VIRVLRFLALLRAALASVPVPHVADWQGERPNPQNCGAGGANHPVVVDPTEIKSVGLRAMSLSSTGRQLSHRPTSGRQASASDQRADARLSCTRQTIATVDAGRQMLLVRRTLEGRPDRSSI